METIIGVTIGVVVGFMQGVIIFILSGIKNEIAGVWKRLNNHYHEVSCTNIECKMLKTGNIVIPGGTK